MHTHKQPHKHKRTTHSSNSTRVNTTRRVLMRPNQQKTTVSVTAKRRPKAKVVTEARPDMPKIWTSAVAKPDMGILFRPIWLGTISGASSSIVKRFYSNSIWMPEVGGTGGQTPGYTDWANFYGFYRVIGFKYKISVANKENFDVNVWTCQSSNDPGTTTNSTINSNPMTQMKQLSAKGGMDRAVFKGKYLISTVAGTEAVYSADTYRSLIGTSPADTTWLAVGVQSFGGTLTNGVDMELELSQKTIMYDFLLQTPAELETIKLHRNWIAEQVKKAPPKSKPLIVHGDLESPTQ